MRKTNNKVVYIHRRLDTNKVFNSLKEACNSTDNKYGTFKWAIRLKKNFKFKYFEE